MLAKMHEKEVKTGGSYKAWAGFLPSGLFFAPSSEIRKTENQKIQK